MQLNVFDICRIGTRALGPGSRYVVWVQGCLQRCPGCITPESRPLVGGTEIDVYDLAADIILAGNIDGITISGGEPFLQSEALTTLLQEVRYSRPELTVIIYTGYEYAELCEDEIHRRLIECADVIIDGKYIEALNDNRGIRGSSNQKVNMVTSRLIDYAEIMETGERKVMKIVEPDGKVTTIGVPDHRQKE